MAGSFANQKGKAQFKSAVMPFFYDYQNSNRNPVISRSIDLKNCLNEISEL